MKTCIHGKQCILNPISRCSSCLFLMSLSGYILTPTSTAVWCSCSTNNPTIFKLFTVVEAQEEYATCHSRLMYLSPLLCGRLTPTQKPVFALSTRAQVAGGGKVELQQRLPPLKSRSQVEDMLSLTKYIYYNTKYSEV